MKMIEKMNTFQSNGKTYNSGSNLHIESIFYSSGKNDGLKIYSHTYAFKILLKNEQHL